MRNYREIEQQELMHKILILAGDITGNLGDMAIAQSTCEQLRFHINGVHITLVANKEIAAEIFPGAEIIPRGIIGLFAQMKAAFGCDLVICGGGGLYQDDDSRIKMPYWGLRVALARMLGAEVVGYCLGVGPLVHGLSRFFCRLAFSCMSAVSVRDPKAFEVARDLTSQHVLIVPDPAIALRAAPAEVAEKLLQDHGVPRDGSPLIGVAVRKWFHHRGSFIPHKVAFRLGLKRTDGGSKFNKMTDLLAEVLDQMAILNDAHIVFLPTYNVPHEGDDLVCEEIGRKMRSNRTSLIKIPEPRLYKAVTGRLSVMLGARMHPMIFAAGMGTPVVGLAYNPKFNGFFELIDSSDKLITIDDFVEKEMTRELFELLENSLRVPKDGLSEAVNRLIERYRNFNIIISNRHIKPKLVHKE
jgi:polysaccharide pyruvyl transferase WcaK-like protein